MKNYNLHALVEGPKSPEDMEETIFGDTNVAGFCEVSAAIAGVAIAGLADWKNRSRLKLKEFQENQRVWWSLESGVSIDEQFFANYVLFARNDELYFGAEYEGCAQPELEFKIQNAELIDNLAKWGLLPVVRQMLLSIIESMEYKAEWSVRYNLRIDPSVSVESIDNLFTKVYIAAMAKYK